MQIRYSGSVAYYVWRRAIPATEIIQPGIADGIADVAQAHRRPAPVRIAYLFSPGRLVLGEYFARTVGQESMKAECHGCFSWGIGWVQFEWHSPTES